MGSKHRRLLALLRQSPFWTSSSRHVETGETSDTCPGLDPHWYFRAHRAFSPLGADHTSAAAHYNSSAGRFRLSPNPVFDEFWYRIRYPDVEDLVQEGRYANAWQHYLVEGCAQGRSPAWWFEERWYRSRNPEVFEAVASGQFSCGLEHYLLYGIRQDLSPGLYFDAAWYRRQYRLAPGEFPVIHYLRSHEREQLCPVRFFDPAWYTANYLSSAALPAVDLRRAPCPFEHYVFYGATQGNSPSARFNEEAYLILNPDAFDSVRDGIFRTGFEHYAAVGAAAGVAVPTHLGTCGWDYAGPRFLAAYDRVLRLSLDQLNTLRRACGKA